MKQCRAFWVFLVILLSALPAFSKPADALFSAQVVVKDRSQVAWSEGVYKALEEVLVKVSGDSKINERLEIKKQKLSLQALVQSYSYTRKALYGQLNQLFMDVQFEAAEVKKLLENGEVPIWGVQRGTTVLWLTLPSDQGRPDVLARDPHSRYVSILQGTADKRGVSLVLPTMDLTEISSITARDIVNKNVSLINEASKRYTADNFLIANVTFEDDQYWHMSCLWVSPAGRVTWELQDASIDNLLAQAINQLTDQMVQQFAHFKGSIRVTEKVLVRVIGVRGINDYTKVIDYLKQLTLIKEVNVETIESDAVVLAVTYGGDQASLAYSVEQAKGNRLVPVDNDDLDTDSNTQQVNFVYRWLEPIAVGIYRDSDLQ